VLGSRRVSRLGAGGSARGTLRLDLQRQWRGYEVFDTEYTIAGNGVGKTLTDQHGNVFTLEGQPVQSKQRSLLEFIHPK
jgi:hypothetical protein